MKTQQIEGLKEAYREEKEPIRRSHIQVVWLMLEGMETDEVAHVTGFTRRWINKLMRRWEAEGLEGLGNKRLRNKGKKPFLGEADLKALAKLLEGPPPDDGLWSGRKVAAWIGERIKRPVGPKQGLRYLHRLGFTRQRPRPQHAKAASPEEREAFKKTAQHGARRTAEKSEAQDRGLGFRRASAWLEACLAPRMGQAWAKARGCQHA